MSFFYLEQRMSLIKENYWEARFQNILREEVVKNEELTYKVAGLETPSMLEERLLVLKPDFSFAKSVRVVRIPYQRIDGDKEEYNVSGRISFAGEIP
ncbi:MAG: hypothetical protein P9L98_03650 [Candidatus Kaelpia imicola]|nr:hypothetical protein [Candidatus Kaelpia imicola]